jgi:signal peptidase I
VSTAHGAIAVARGARRYLDGVALLLCAVAVAAVLAAGVLMPFGNRFLTVRSDSMVPTFSSGDVVVSRVSAPADVAVGDVVTFRDPTRENILVTHRVVKRHAGPESVRFVTQGDANTGQERWSIPRDGTVGRVWLTVPNVGYVVAWAGTPAARIGLIGAASLVLLVAVLRRIWRG